MSGDDWRGLDRLVIAKRSREEINRETNSIASKIAHAKRRAKGCSMAQSGGRWARQIQSWHLSGKIKGGQE